MRCVKVRQKREHFCICWALFPTSHCRFLQALGAVNIPGRPGMFKSAQRPANDKRNPDVSAFAGRFLHQMGAKYSGYRGVLNTTVRLWQKFSSRGIILQIKSSRPRNFKILLLLISYYGTDGQTTSHTAIKG